VIRCVDVDGAMRDNVHAHDNPAWASGEWKPEEVRILATEELDVEFLKVFVSFDDIRVRVLGKMGGGVLGFITGD